MKVLGIETSCDETAVAVYASDGGLLAHEVYSQIALHAEYGGVVPELASRDHIRKLSPLVEQVLAAVVGDVDGVAYTAGPGLLGALLVGAAFARSFAYARNLPACGVHHLEGHLLAPLLEDEAPDFPFVALIVSGGHTLLVDVSGVGEYQLLGESLDDAAGEAFDKTAKLMGLPYPGGPALARLAESGQPGLYAFPRPMTNRPGLDFSFSGLKTAALLAWRDSAQDDTARANIARSFEDAVVETLLLKCRRALKQTGHKRLVVAGGVGANKRLRQSLREDAVKQNGAVYFPRPEFCTDNAAMIAYAGWQRLRHGLGYGPGHGGINESVEIHATARWPLDTLQSPTAG